MLIYTPIEEIKNFLYLTNKSIDDSPTLGYRIIINFI